MTLRLEVVSQGFSVLIGLGRDVIHITLDNHHHASSSYLPPPPPRWSPGRSQRGPSSPPISYTGLQTQYFMYKYANMITIDFMQHGDHKLDLPTSDSLGLVWQGLALLCRCCPILFFILIITTCLSYANLILSDPHYDHHYSYAGNISSR